MRKWILLWLSLTSLALARPVQSPRGLVSFDVPNNLAQTGGSSWGNVPGIMIEMREEYAPKGELKPLILSMSRPSPNSKKVKDEGTEVDGQEGQIVARLESGSLYKKCLFVRRGGFNYGWSVTSMQLSREEIDAVFERLKESIKFNADPTQSLEFSREVRDPSGQLQVTLPKNFGSSDGRKYTDGDMMVILTPLREGGDQAQRDFAFKYQPKGYKVYMRRARVEMGDHKGALIMARSDDELLESQMVMLTSDKAAVVLTFIAPVKLSATLSVVRETVVGNARWANSGKSE